MVATVHKILIADDERPLRIALGRFVRQMGMEADLVESGEAALERLDGCQLVITDVCMPGIDGMSLLKEIRKRRPELPVLVMSGHGTISMAVTAMQSGAVNFLTKPFPLEEFEEVVRLAVDGDGRAPKLSASTSEDAHAGSSPAMAALHRIVAKVAASDVSVLIQGESGSGKEVVARAIHRTGTRKDKPLVAVNCGAIPENLVESELFGHVRGAFTGAVQDRDGSFAQATGGTLLLDEVGELPLNMQVKLLRVLQDRTYTPVGAEKPSRADVRVLAATHRDLESMVAEGTFREDLYYRLNVFSIQVPPLRERVDDIMPLAARFLGHASRAQRVLTGFSDEAVRALNAYDWPGNVRELEHAVQHAAVLAEDTVISLADLPPRPRACFGTPLRRQATHTSARDNATSTLSLPDQGLDLRRTLQDLEEQLIHQALGRTGGNRNQAAALLGLNRTTLVEKLKRMGV